MDATLQKLVDAGYAIVVDAETESRKNLRILEKRYSYPSEYIYIAFHLGVDVARCLNVPRDDIDRWIFYYDCLLASGADVKIPQQVQYYKKLPNNPDSYSRGANCSSFIMVCKVFAQFEAHY